MRELTYYTNAHTHSLQTTARIHVVAGQHLEEGTGGMPVFLYGDASEQKESLVNIRRRLGYFQNSLSGGAPSNTAECGCRLSVVDSVNKRSPLGTDEVTTQRTSEKLLH